MKKLLALFLIAMMVSVPFLALAAEKTVTIEHKKYKASLKELDLSNVKITSKKALEEALGQMSKLQYVNLSYCGLSYDTLADMRTRWSEHGVKIVWTLRFGRWTVKTDVTAFSCLNDSHSPRYESNVLKYLKYCNELKAVDLGHNWLYDIDFLKDLNDLRVVIISDNRLLDVSALDGKPIEYLEMFNNKTKDISFLSDCTTLIDLNICNTHISDLSPLYNLPNLKRLWAGDIDEMKQSYIDRFLEKQPNLEAYNFTTKYPTMFGWRENYRYEVVKAIFKERVYYPFDYVLDESQYVTLFKNQSLLPEQKKKDSSEA